MPISKENKASPFVTLFSLLFILSLLSASPARASWDEAKTIPIQHNGRIKPFGSFARQTLKTVAGKESWQGKKATVFMLDLLADKKNIAQEHWILIDYGDLKKYLGLNAQYRHFSLEELAPVYAKIRALTHSVDDKIKLNERPSKLEQKAEMLIDQLQTVQALASGDSIRVIPGSAGASWESPYQTSGELSNDFKQIVDAYKAHSHAQFTKQLNLWMEKIRIIDKNIPLGKIALELVYNQSRPFEWAAILYFMAFIMFVFFRKQYPFFAALSFWLVFLAFFFHSFGLLVRVIILSRLPVSNMYESMIFMNWALMIFALTFSVVRRSFIPTIAGSLISGFIMVYANLLPIDPSLDVVVAVLKSSYWLTIHVLTVVASYGAFGLALALGHRHLFLSKTERFTPAQEEESARLIFRVIQLGVILIGTGTFLGGVWANESWGRFWGWDPKETWALITFLGYLIVIHLRYRRKINDFFLALSTLFGFALVLMTWYGVNFILGRGLHSYGAGSGGTEWIIYYLIAEVLFVVWVFSRRSKIF